jgi:2-keto-4-pentenoate hydratase/2-oxohepta-3-ene-1,7-dioic acid hydratase in catechol pathway
VKLANLDGRAVIVSDDGAIDVAAASNDAFGPSLPSIYDRWDDFVAAAGSFAIPPARYDAAQLGPPSPTPRQVFAIGLNYRAHAEETGQAPPEMPATFTKFPSALNGPYGDVVLPADTVDWEVELVVVIGREATDVDRADAWSYVAGLTVGQDISERTTQMAAGRQFSLGKSFRTFAPTGPWVVTVDELADPTDLGLGCSIDGETVQESRTSDLIFPVDDLIARLSAIVTLYPGDLIFTGTPSGVGVARQPPRFLHAGEVLETWIEGIGRLRNPVVEKGA